jgi:phosphoribosylamine--glycine ligase
VTEEISAAVRDAVLAPTLVGMAEEGTPYSGILYAGIMLTASGPKVLEFNCRFGDPETQAVLPLLESDLVAVLDAVASGRLADTEVRWRRGAAVCVVMTAKGYPGECHRGDPITGLEAFDGASGVSPAVVFHAGTAREGMRLVTSGGRVLGVTGMGDTLSAARDRAYAAVGAISFPGAFSRSDIALRAVVAASERAT